MGFSNRIALVGGFENLSNEIAEASGYLQSQISTLCASGQTADYIIQYPYVLTPTCGPSSDGIFYIDSYDVNSTWSQVAYMMAYKPSEDTTIRITSGATANDIIVPSGSINDVETLPIVIVHTPGNTISCQVISGAGGVLGSLRLRR